LHTDLYFRFHPRHYVAERRIIVCGVRKSSTLPPLAPPAAGAYMEILVEFGLMYLAIGVVLFALIPGQALPVDFHWRNQAIAFCDSLPEVLAWPLALWRVCWYGRFLD
jgi:hypothetical protein